MFGKGRWNLICSLYEAYEIISKMYFLRQSLTRAEMDKYIFPWQLCFIWEVVFDKSHCILVNMQTKSEL